MQEDISLNYFDYAASTPLHLEAAKVYTTLAQNCYGNTSSLHEVGGEAQNVLTYAKQELAKFIGVEKAGIFFTGSGTESNLLSVISLALANEKKGNHIITSLGEHPSIDSALEYLRGRGFTITKIPFTAEGIIDIDQLTKAITPKTIMLSVQHINPEIGSIQPIEDISEIARKHGILLHSDCIQSFGKINLQPIAKLVDSLTISAHKIYGPKGVGVAYINPKNRIQPVFPGLVHENGFRGGTVNIPGIAAFITAIQHLQMDEDLQRFSIYRQMVVEKLSQYPNRFTVYEQPDTKKQLPHILGFGVHHIEGQLMMLELNRRGYAISTGSACQVGQQNASKVMLALDIEEDRAREFIRISFGKTSTTENVQALIRTIIEIEQQLTSIQTTTIHKEIHV